MLYFLGLEQKLEESPPITVWHEPDGYGIIRFDLWLLAPMFETTKHFPFPLSLRANTSNLSCISLNKDSFFVMVTLFQYWCFSVIFACVNAGTQIFPLAPFLILPRFFLGLGFIFRGIFFTAFLNFDKDARGMLRSKSQYFKQIWVSFLFKPLLQL